MSINKLFEDLLPLKKFLYGGNWQGSKSLYLNPFQSVMEYLLIFDIMKDKMVGVYDIDFQQFIGYINNPCCFLVYCPK